MTNQTEDRQTTFISHASYRPVAAMETVTVLARPQVPFLEPYKLFIPREIADCFLIQEVRVGNRSMFPAAQSILAEQFSHGDGHLFKCEPIHIGQDFSMDVTNISGGMRTFRASWACYLPHESKLPAFEKQESVLDRLRRVTDETIARGRESIQRAKDIVEEIVYPGRQAAKPPRQLPKPKDPPNFGWDPHGDD